MAVIKTPVMELEGNIIKKQVMNKTDDHLIRHQVIGLGGEAPVLQKIEIYENGTYNPPAGTDGYNEVVVNVPGGMPIEGVVRNYDLTTESELPILDPISKSHLFSLEKDNPNYGLYKDDGIDGMAFHSTYGQLITGINLDDVFYNYDLEIELGSVGEVEDPATAYNRQYNMLFQFSRQIRNCLYYDGREGHEGWYFYLANNINLNLSNVTDLKNKKIKLHFEPYGNASRIYNVTLYIDDVMIFENQRMAEVQATPQLYIGGYDNKAMTYAYFKSIKFSRTLREV